MEQKKKLSDLIEQGMGMGKVAYEQSGNLILMKGQTILSASAIGLAMIADDGVYGYNLNCDPNERSIYRWWWRERIQYVGLPYSIPCAFPTCELDPSKACSYPNCGLEWQNKPPRYTCPVADCHYSYLHEPNISHGALVKDLFTIVCHWDSDHKLSLRGIIKMLREWEL